MINRHPKQKTNWVPVNRPTCEGYLRAALFPAHSEKMIKWHFLIPAWIWFLGGQTPSIETLQRCHWLTLSKIWNELNGRKHVSTIKSINLRCPNHDTHVNAQCLRSFLSIFFSKTSDSTLSKYEVVINSRSKTFWLGEKVQGTIQVFCMILMRYFFN